MNLNLIKSLLGDLDMSQKESNVSIFLVEKIDIKNLNLVSNSELLKQIADISDDSAFDKNLQLAESPTNDNEQSKISAFQ